jgi:hypothetical protein
MSKRKWRDRAQAAASAVASAIGGAAPADAADALVESGLLTAKEARDPAIVANAAAIAADAATRAGAAAAAGMITSEEATEYARTAVGITADLPLGAKFIAGTSAPRGFVRADFGIAPVNCDRRLVFVDSIEWRCACGARGLSVRPGDGVPYHDTASMAHLPGESKSGTR